MIPKSRRFKIINELRGSYPITWLIEIAQVSRSGYYKWLKTRYIRENRQTKQRILESHIMAIHFTYPFYGYPRMEVALKEEGFHINHKKVYRLMKELNIQAEIRKKRPFFGKKPSVIYSNLLNRNFKALKPDQKYVTDITYIQVGDSFYYLSVILDLYNNEVLAWEISKRNDLDLVLNTLDHLIQKRNVYGAILHSDQGFQYTSKQYNKRLKNLGIQGSHSRKGNCLDNACIESFFSHLKTEKLYRSQFKTEEELIQVIEEYIYLYNFKRFQKKLNQCAPVEYRITLAA